MSYDTLQALLEAYPDAASVKCELKDIRTFIPDHSIPLELHDRLSTDFPKWETQQIETNPSEEVTQAILDKTYGTKNGMRRSDLMFAFYQDVLPYRKETTRIRRMEQRIRNELVDLEARGEYSLTLAAELYWVWLCDFENPEDDSDHYTDSVKRIIYSIPARVFVSWHQDLRTMESQSLIVSLLDVRMYFLKGLKKQETLKLQFRRGA